MFDYTGYVVICFHFSIFEPLETTSDSEGKIQELL